MLNANTLLDELRTALREWGQTETHTYVEWLAAERVVMAATRLDEQLSTRAVQLPDAWASSATDVQRLEHERLTGTPRRRP